MSQVTPGGGVLKLTLTKKGPLKITTEPQKKPDPSQTTVKLFMIPQKRKNHFKGVKVSGIKQPTEKEKILEVKEFSPKGHLLIKKIKASLKVGAQSGKLNQVVMGVLMETGDQIKVENHQEKGKDHQMGLEK